MNKKHILHLYWRAGFGLSPQEFQEFTNTSKQEIIDDLFQKSSKIKPLIINTSQIDSYTAASLKDNAMQKTANRKLNLALIKKYNHLWINRLTYSNQSLRERMTLFWANHFVVKNARIKQVMHFNNTLRTHALGDFRSFVKEISKESAMISYLDLNKNVKKNPNENFARELMELFTLGENKYSEQDIKESARAFSGYKFKFDGTFVFNKRQHDTGDKTFFGETGNFDGDQIIDIILKQKQCARFICEKIYKYFVNEIVDTGHLNLMTEVFYKDYNIENLMRYVFESDWFYSEENIGTKIKSPIELLIGIHKTIPIRFNNTDELLKVQTILDQKLLFPANVAGWKGGRNWINTNSILIRVKLPSMLLERESFTIKPKGNFTDNFKLVYVKNKYQDKLDVSVDWRAYKKQVKKMSSNDLIDCLILSKINSGTINYLKSLGKLRKKRNLAKIMSLPEYQMC